MHTIRRISEFAKRHKWSTGFVVLIALGGVAFAGTSGKNGITEVEAARRTLVQEVAVSGKVKPVESVELAFEKTGKVGAVFARVGAKIQQGSRLVTLESGELYANLLQAKANLNAELAKLDEMKKGTRPEEILVYEAKVLTAERAFADAKNGLEDKLADAFTKSDDAIRDKVDQLFNGAGSGRFELNIFIADGQLEATVEEGRTVIEAVLDDWAALSVTLGTDPDTDPVVAKVQVNLEKLQTFLNKMALVVNELNASPSISQATIDGYRSDVSAARTNVNTAITNLSSAVEKWNNAATSLVVAEKELALKRAGSAPEAIASQEASVEEQRAAIASIEAQLANQVLISPIRGTVTFLEVKPGEIVGAGAKVASVISEDALEIEAYVSEVNVGRVAVGNPTRITLDAFPGEEFKGTITYIEPAETLIDGVVSFKIKAAFVALDTRLKSGLTSNVYIETARREYVVTIPRFAVEVQDGKAFVSVRGEDGNITKREIVIGLQGIDGFVEAVSGISEGDVVLIAKR